MRKSRWSTKTLFKTEATDEISPLRQTEKASATAKVNAISAAGWGVGFLPLHMLGLTVGGISQKPGVHEGQIAIREYLNLTLSFDRDIVDGAPDARFARAFTELVESAPVFEQRT